MIELSGRPFLLYSTVEKWRILRYVRVAERVLVLQEEPGHPVPKSVTRETFDLSSGTRFIGVVRSLDVEQNMGGTNKDVWDTQKTSGTREGWDPCCCGDANYSRNLGPFCRTKVCVA